ncbi:MAG TPA: hypothetical protein VMW27_20110 [Thermoanaerobaculia bacterium]|nr:hypothetical protein [Thermoanaerobaculia bacterium]
MPARLLTLILILLPLRLDAGQNVWTPLGPEGGAVTALAVAANGRTVYAGTPAGGVFKSINTGRSWSPVNRGLRGAVNDLEVHPRDFRIVYAATSQGLFQSRDAGASWADLTFRLPVIGFPIGALVVAASPADPGTVYLSVIDLESKPRFYRSSDEGVTWNHVRAAPNSTIQTLAVHPSRPGVVYAGAEDGVYRSDDAGWTWRRAGLRGDIEQLAFDAVQPDLLYAVRTIDGHRVPDLEAEVYVRRQEGPWQKVGAGLRGGGDVQFAVDPFTAGTAYLSVTNFNSSLFKTTDGGRTWRSVLDHALASALAANPGVPGMLFLGRPSYTATTLLRSTDAGGSWTVSSSGLRAQPTHEILAGAPGTFYTYFYDAWKTTDGGGTWRPLVLPLSPSQVAADIAVDPATPTTVYVSDNEGRLFRSLDAGGTWTEVTSYETNGFGNRLTHLRFDPADPNILYGIFNQFYPGKSTDGGVHWTLLPQPQRLETSVLTTVAGPPTVVYANGVSFSIVGAFSDDRINRSTDGGATWDTLLTVRDMFFTDIAADPRLPGRILASFRWEVDFHPPVRVGGVYLSTDDGLHWTRGNIPPDNGMVPSVFSLAFDPRNPMRVYAGAAGAVFLSEDGGANWTSISTGLPPADVVDLQVDPYSPDTVYAATLGGSIYVFTHGH